MARSEAYDRHPSHTLVIGEDRAHIKISVGGTPIAATEKGLNLREGKYPAIVYVPREDVRMERLAQSDQSTHCPFKGNATYFDFLGDPGAGDATQGAGSGIEQVAWSYEDPFDQMLELKGHLAFYADRVDIESGSK